MDALALDLAAQQHSLQHPHPQRPQQTLVYPHPLDAYADHTMTPHSRQQQHHQHQHQHQQQRVGAHFAHAPPSSAPSSNTAAAPLPDLQKPTFFGNSSAAPPPPPPPSAVHCDIKPRLTKEQHDILEAHYQKQNKPNTSTKKGFAETLNVSLDKINNWFQNRRAKSKQDAKKQAVSLNPAAAQQQQQQQQPPLQQQQQSQQQQQQSQQQQQQSQQQPQQQQAPPPPPPPSLPLHIRSGQQQVRDDGTASLSSSGDYYAPQAFGMSSQEDLVHLPNSLAGVPPFHTHGFFAQYPQADSAEGDNLQQYNIDSQTSQNMFDSDLEINRRTLTQEAFDMFEQNGSMPPTDLPFYTGDDLVNNFKPHTAFQLRNDIAASLSSHDSTIPSSVSDMSTYDTSEWADSRSSSVAGLPAEDILNGLQPQGMATSSQWQLGQSIPVDIEAMNQEFQKAQQLNNERSLGWPSENLIRRDSQASLLTQKMSHVEIQAPPPAQNSDFKTPAPPSSIAARRQRPRPAALGIAAMRSQSYSGSAQPSSPGINGPPSATTQATPTLRRIRSSNVVSGVSQGRVQKSLPGSGQRSPLAFTFAESLSSPKALRHQSSGTLAPPTPMSPKDFSLQQWQATTRQPSISESDAEHMLPFATLSMQNFSSPPHTPAFQQNPYMQYLGNSALLENTPPQSAPATQTSFYNPFPMAPPPTLPQHPASLRRNVDPTDMQSIYASATIPEDAAFSNLVYSGEQQLPFADGTNNLSMPYSNDTLLMDNVGDLAMPFSLEYGLQGHAQQLPQQLHQPLQPQSKPQPSPLQTHDLVNTQGQSVQYSASSVSPLSYPEQPSTVPSEFFIHEYNPPPEPKREMEARVPLDQTPKSYTFANHGPEHFTKGKLDAPAKPGSTASPDGSIDQ